MNEWEKRNDKKENMEMERTQKSMNASKMNNSGDW